MLCNENDLCRIPQPFIQQRADPWILRADDGSYLFTASVPEHDRIELRRSATLAGLAQAEAVTVWRKHESGPMSWHVWAPEIHRLDGAWWIYFAAGERERIWNIRIWALKCMGQDPLKDEWVERGQIKTDFDSFSLDATTFQHRGARYMVWAQKTIGGEESSDLYIAKMRSPTELELPATRISQPTEAWERVGFNVNEGPAVLIRHGRIWISYSASATDENYCMGLLWTDEDADLLDARSWTKSSVPVFSTDAALKRFGPGHNSFTVTEDGGTDVMVYHAREYAGTYPSPLADPNRHARLTRLDWDTAGRPIFRDDRKPTVE